MADTPPIGTPIYAAGLDAGDELRTLDGIRLTSPEDVFGVLRRHRPDDTISVTYVDRTGGERKTQVILREDPQLELLPVESTGASLTPEQRKFRESWLK